MSANSGTSCSIKCLKLLFFFSLEALICDNDLSLIPSIPYQDCMVDEDGKFTELAGTDLQGKLVMVEGNDTGERVEANCCIQEHKRSGVPEQG